MFSNVFITQADSEKEQNKHRESKTTKQSKSSDANSSDEKSDRSQWIVQNDSNHDFVNLGSQEYLVKERAIDEENANISQMMNAMAILFDQQAQNNKEFEQSLFLSVISAYLQYFCRYITNLQFREVELQQKTV